jgi:hypothetical protein
MNPSGMPAATGPTTPTNPPATGVVGSAPTSSPAARASGDGAAGPDPQTEVERGIVAAALPGAVAGLATVGPAAGGVRAPAAAAGPQQASGSTAEPDSPPRCRNCGTPRQPHPGGGWRGGRGWCNTCYSRWLYAGKPDDEPPPPPNAAIDGRREDYAWLRDEQGLTLEQAADRMRISERTAWRYEARRRRAVPA